VLEASKRSLPEVTDEFANGVRAGLTAESLKKELQTAVDVEDAKEYTPARNAALSKALAQVMEVEVPDTLVTNQAREKFAMMMSDMRNNGVSDEEIKNQINPDNFLKYKNIVKDDIIRDFKVSMATDEIARLENVEVEDYQVEEQMESIKQDAQNSKEDFDEGQIRSKVESTLQRQAVMELLAESADLDVTFVEGEIDFDESLMEKLAEESIARDEKSETGESPAVVDTSATDVEEIKEVEAPTLETVAEDTDSDSDSDSMSLQEKAFNALKDSGALDSGD